MLDKKIKAYEKDKTSISTTAQIRNEQFYLSKIGLIEMRGFREFDGKLKTVTVSCEANQYHASLLFDDGRAFVKPSHNGKKVGIDMGVAIFATLSNGKMHMPLKLDKEIKKMKKAQKSLSRKKTVEEPKKSSGKRGLNRVITQQSWGIFFEMLKYKAEKKGGEIIEVDPKFTSQKCSCCGYISKENRKSQSKFKCIQCQFELNADLNASLNILNSVGHMEKAS